MKTRRIAKMLALVLTLVTMVSCVAIFMTTTTHAGSYMVFTGADLNSKWSGAYQLNKSLSGTELTLTSTGNDPYFFINGLDEYVLRTYPYVVIRYKSSVLSTFEIFSGHPDRGGSLRVSMPCVPTNGNWGCLYYDFHNMSQAQRSWFRLEPFTQSGQSMVIADVALFTDSADAQTYANVYAGAGTSAGGYCLTFNDFGYHGNGTTGRDAANETSGVSEVRLNNDAGAFADGGYYVRLTASGGDPYITFHGDAKTAAGTYSYVAVRYRTAASTGATTMKVYTAFDENYATTTGITADGCWHWATFALKKNRSCFRLDYIHDGASSGDVMDIGEIFFYNNTADLYNQSVGACTNRNGAANWTYWPSTAMYFLHKADNITYFQSDTKCSGGTYSGYYRSGTGSAFHVGTATMSTVGRTFVKASAYHSAHQDNGGTVTANATCTAAGSRRYNCTLCNDQTRTESIAALGHANGPAATCTTAQTCTRCSVQLAAALGHASVTDAAVSPDCTHTGLTEGAHCSRCSTVLTAQKEVAALGHNAEGSVAHVDATCTETGVVGGTYCNRCNDGKTAVEAIIAALGHNAEGSVAHKDATCTETGVVGGTYCNRCNEGKTAVEAIIDAMGHDITVKPGTPATYTCTGLSEGTKCSRCTEMDSEQAVLPKLNPLVTYAVALNQNFAVSVKFVYFTEDELTPVITVLDETGLTYAGCQLSDTGKIDSKTGLPLWEVYIPNISARDIGHVFTVSESHSGHSTNVSIDGYCATVENMYKDATVESLTEKYVAAGMDPAQAETQATIEIKSAVVSTQTRLYGTAAYNYQNQTGEGVDHEELAQSVPHYDKATSVQNVSNTGEVKFTGASMVFGEGVEMLLRMQNYNREKIYVQYGDGEFVEIPEDEINSHLSSDGTYVYFSLKLTPEQYDMAITVRAGSVEEDFIDYFAGSSKVTYSVHTYIANMQAKYAGQTSAKAMATLNLVNALGHFGDSAADYRHVLG